MNRLILTFMLVLAAVTSATAQDSTSLSQTPKKRNFIRKIIDYVGDVDASETVTKDVSWNFIGGPYYDSDSKFSIAINGTCNYRLRGCDLEMQPSFATTYATISTAGFWTVGIEGTTFFKEDKQRINYELSLGYSPRNYWGIGYGAAVDSTSINLKQKSSKVHGEYIVMLLPNLYVGPAVEWNYNMTGQDIDLSRLYGQDRKVNNLGVGVVMQYDTRDLVTNASRGVYVHLNAMFNPKFMFNKYHFTRLDFTSSYYHKLWKDAIIAGQVKTQFNFGNPSWAMMALYGNSEFMRGYYKGRFRDKHMTLAQVELRQHVWRRNGIVVWGGIGTVYHDKDSFGRNWLPNYGIGYRWEFRRRMNLRLDCGFGAHGQSGIMFSMNEAF